MNTFWGIVKDGLGAFLFWVVARVLLVHFWGYTGYLLSQMLGAILLFIFVGRNLVRFRMYLQGAYRRRMQPGGWPSDQTPGSVPMGNSGGRPCPNCSGGRNSCYACNGSGSRYEGGAQPVLCSVCAGQRFVTCTTCSGSGRVYW